jgi:glycosyltransferase involved in cell wall biosynthesis
MDRLLIVTTSYPEHQPNGRDAAGSFVADFVEELSRTVRVSVVAPGREPVREERLGLTVHRFAVPHLPLSTLEVSNPLHWPAVAKTLTAGAKATRLAAFELRPQFILALWALPSGFWARGVARALGVPYGVWALGSDIWSLKRIPVVRTYLRSILRGADRRFADGFGLGSDVERIAQKPCRFLPSVRRISKNGAKLLRDSPPYRLGFLGRWHANKGIDLLMEALAGLDGGDRQKVQEIKIAGGGPLEPIVLASASELQNRGWPVKISGYLDKPNAEIFLRSIDYLIIPSRIESIPVVFSDAMQTGCAVVASPVGDLPRLVTDYEVGVLADAVSPRALSSAIATALERNPKSFEQGLRKAASEFDVSDTVTRFLAEVG